MKKIAFVSGLILSSVAFADIDYTRCNQTGLGFGTGSLNNDGKFVPHDDLEIVNVETKGNVETYQLKQKKNSWGFGAMEQTITIVRDEDGRVSKVKTGGEKPPQNMIDAWTRPYVNGMTVSGGYGGGHSYPTVKVNGRNVSLDKLTNEEAKKAGFGKSLDKYRKLQSQHRKDKATQEKMRGLYSNIHDNADYVIPFGLESEFQIQDGVCMLKSMSQRTYSTKSKEVSSQLVSSRESCEEIKKLHKKYEPKLNECQNVNDALNKEYWENFGSKKSMNPYGGFGIAGGIAGGATGGYVGGIAGGFAGGYNSAPYVGGITGELWNCEYYYGVQPIQYGGMVGGSGPGTGIGFGTQQ